MSLRASAHALIVTPTGDDTETERGALIVISKPMEGRTQPVIYRGVIEHVGSHMTGHGMEVGHVVFYTDFMEVEGKHVVSDGYLVAFDDGEADE